MKKWKKTVALPEITVKSYWLRHFLFIRRRCEYKRGRCDLHYIKNYVSFYIALVAIMLVSWCWMWGRFFFISSNKIGYTHVVLGERRALELVGDRRTMRSIALPSLSLSVRLSILFMFYFFPAYSLLFPISFLLLAMFLPPSLLVSCPLWRTFGRTWMTMTNQNLQKMCHSKNINRINIR